MSDLMNGLRHMADDHPCCRETLRLTIDTIEELERENAALRKQLADVSRVRYSLEDSLTRAHNEAEACWKDKERLDWLEARGEPQTYEDAPHSLVWYVLGEDGERNLRAAIDAARAKEDQS